jgi:hypothetical protein
VVTESFLVSSVLNAIPATAGAISLTSATYLSGILPVANGGTGLSAGGPAFSAYLSTAQTLTGGVTTKVTCQTEEFDTNSNYDNATNYRFTPTVAGYYQVNGSVRANSAYTTGIVHIYKNGSIFKTGNVIQSDGAQFIVSALVYFNGSTDYVELYVMFVTGQNLSAQLYDTYFQASMVRSA